MTTMISTRHSRDTGVYIAHFGPAHWRHVDCNDPGRRAQVGPVYRSRAELLADHEDYLRRAGWLVDPSTKSKEQS